MLTFNCPRTCPLAKEEVCRFAALIPGATVNSYTVKIKASFTDPVALAKAVQQIGGTYVGPRKDVYVGIGDTVCGLLFKLPALDQKTKYTWDFVAVESGELVFDGDIQNLVGIDRLKAEYAIAVAEQAALNLGWMLERTEHGLLIHHPSGGTMTVSSVDGVVDASNFHGVGCHDAITALSLPWEAATAKTEYTEVAAKVAATQG